MTDAQFWGWSIVTGLFILTLVVIVGAMISDWWHRGTKTYEKIISEAVDLPRAVDDIFRPAPHGRI